jgi:ABC-type lipoprotein release transport system permease subunit
MKVLNYFSIIAILLSAISLFGILNIVMEKRMKSLQLLRNIGCSKVRIARILSLEWLFLLICGVICGVIFGVGIYEIVLWIQDKFFGLSKLRGYTAEWAILQVTRNPFITAVVSTVLMFFLGYFIYFIRYRFFRVQKKQNRRKARSFGRIKRILFGIPFSNIMQMLSIALILTTTVMCYSYYTQNGKGNGYFTDEEASGKSYYSYANVSMNEDNVDICLYDTNNGCAGGITVLSDTGLSEEKLNQISQIDGIETVQSFSNNTAFNVYYPTDDLDVPYQIKEYQAEFPENADEFYHSDERNYYLIPMITGNKTAMDHLSDYIIDGTIGNHEDGIVVVLYGDPEYVESPYSVGERVNFISVYAGGATISHDGEAVIDAIAVIPESAEEEDPVTYAGFGENTICFAATQATASYLETNKKNYDYTYITLSDTADLSTITSEIQNYLDSSTGLKMQTLEECDKAFKQSRINRYASTLFIFVILIFMTIIGYYGLISMRRQNASKNIAVLRSLGMTGRSCNFTFLWSNIKNTLIACVLGTLFVYGLRNLISYKYQSALDAFGYPESDLIMASDEVYAKVNNLNSTYLLNYEIQNAPVIKIILLVSAILILMSVMISVLCLNPKNQKSIILQIHDNTKE